MVLPSEPVAWIVTGFWAGGVAGAVYSPVAVIDPSLGLFVPIPVTDHVTAVLGNPVTAAENCWVNPTPTYGFAGVTVIV
jgi:fumarate reductase subunit D